MRLPGRLFVLLTLAACLAASAGCGEDDHTGLSLTWRPQTPDSPAVLPAQAFATSVYIANTGNRALDGVVLRFDQLVGGTLPLGISIGTATNAPSRFDGDAQVWDLGRIEPNQTLLFPVTLWFDATSPTAETRNLSLYLQVTSPDLEAQVLSNALEVEVDTRAAVTTQ